MFRLAKNNNKELLKEGNLQESLSIVSVGKSV